MTLEWMRQCEVNLSVGLGTIRGGPYAKDVTARVSGLFDPNRPPVVVGGYATSYGHYAIDVYAPTQYAPIFCLADGVVSFVQNASPGNANAVWVDHQDEYSSRYYHLRDNPNWVVGQSIARGDIIGFEDTTGIANGSHLHLEIRRSGFPLDPLTVLMLAPDLTPEPVVIVPKMGDPSPLLTLSQTQQLLGILGNGTVVFPGNLTPASGTEPYLSIKDGMLYTLTTGELTAEYRVYVPLWNKP